VGLTIEHTPDIRIRILADHVSGWPDPVSAVDIPYHSGEQARERGAEFPFHSLHERTLPPPDETRILPGHPTIASRTAHRAYRRRHVFATLRGTRPPPARRVRVRRRLTADPRETTGLRDSHRHQHGAGERGRRGGDGRTRGRLEKLCGVASRRVTHPGLDRLRT
jgi:hypothetical protein